MGSKQRTILNDKAALQILRDCDRTRSQEARRALRKLLWQPLQAHNIELQDPSCPLSPIMDILALQDSSKVYLSGRIWKCTICGKLFSSEHYLDMHQARRHPDLHYKNGSLCLADLCDIYVPCIPIPPPDGGELKPPVSSTGLGKAQPSSNSSFQLPPFCHMDSARRLHERQMRVLRCSHVVEECLQSAIDVDRDRYLYQRHVDRLKIELCQRASEVACVPREQFHSDLHPAHLHLNTSAGFPTLYITLSTITMTVLCFLLYCFCPNDMHTIERFPSRRDLTKSSRQRRVRRHLRSSAPRGFVRSERVDHTIRRR